MSSLGLARVSLTSSGLQLGHTQERLMILTVPEGQCYVKRAIYRTSLPSVGPFRAGEVVETPSHQWIVYTGFLY